MSRWGASLRLIGVGWFIGISVLLGVLGGSWLDTRFDTRPLFVIAGLLLGLVAAGYGVYQMLIPLLKDKNNREDG